MIGTVFFFFSWAPDQPHANYAASKDENVDHESKEFAHLDKKPAELSADQEGVQDELSAVLGYPAISRTRIEGPWT